MKKLIVLFMLCAALSVGVTASFLDMPDNWSTTALQSAVDNGLMGGSNGYIYPDNNLTRAEMAAIITRAFGATATTDISRFTDVKSDKWYYEEMSASVAMGAFNGDGNKLNPDKPITREEAFTVIARVFNLETDITSPLDKFSDKDKVSDWSKKYVSALVEKGYVNGSNGALNIKSTITRAEFAQVMHNIVKAYITDTNYQKTYDGNVVVKKNVSLSNLTVNGDLVIADGVEGTVKFDNVTVKGRIVFRSASGSEIDGSFGVVTIVGDNIKIAATHDSTVGYYTINGENSSFSIKVKPSVNDTYTPPSNDNNDSDDNTTDTETPEIDKGEGQWSQWYN